jgi:hypothetical protein
MFVHCVQNEGVIWKRWWRRYLLRLYQDAAKKKGMGSRKNCKEHEVWGEQRLVQLE